MKSYPPFQSVSTLRFCMYLYFSGVTSQSECPHGWTRRDSSCYLFVTHVANDWTESEVRAVFIFNLVENIFFFQFYILSYFTFIFIHVNSVVKMWAVENMHFSLKKTLFGYTDVTCNWINWLANSFYNCKLKSANNIFVLKH